ncbi:hypothetical protein PHYPSEUDO_001698 [Phytophthora pseudosyringae]|uniref:Uncharacterized protein n=1 Tax=Phytophthora pseudosyringae TaxID=221518 RepID=A0A8T1VZ53_9STRA|nr:hypothetical protein PHYPSEUDO_001698 [Phytophthora pseudosyringae]
MDTTPTRMWRRDVLDHWHEEKGARNTVAENSGIHHPNHQWFEFKVQDVFVGLRNRKSKRFLDHYYTKEIRVNGDNCSNVARQWCLIWHHPPHSSIEIISCRNVKSGKILENNGNVDAVKSRATTDNHLASDSSMAGGIL